ncbi:hypothetical protein C8046_14330 [Serinibacter arcticus]|uniref:LppX_LprAFG lipoprotein n=1 Tax=Serinibacter arcticus TaxID=1655435 RepID=A0A2U1ZXD0_9MICO|nr:hypothetical protein [Serinibacter arcticus]PWD51647.1 hypothetical protein C8046_14330 [Serinibacter arcticus]
MGHLHRRSAAAATAVLAVATILAGCTSLPIRGLTVAAPLASDFAPRLERALEHPGPVMVMSAFDMPGYTLTTFGHVDPSTSPHQVSVSASVTEDDTITEVEIRVVDGEVWVNLAETSQDRFLLASEETTAITGDPALLTLGIDPLVELRAFPGALVSAERAGTDAINGERLDRYEVTLDLARLQPVHYGSDPSAVGEIDYEVWFDGDDHVRKVSGELVDGIRSNSFTLSNWGVGTTFEVPSEDERISLAELTGAIDGV